MVHFSEHIILCLCYNVPTGSSREMFNDQNIYDAIIDDMLYFQNMFGDNCQFMITGDLNSRIGKLHDFVEDEFLCNVNLMPEEYVEDTFCLEVTRIQSQTIMVNI